MLAGHLSGGPTKEAKPVSCSLAVLRDAPPEHLLIKSLALETRVIVLGNMSEKCHPSVPTGSARLCFGQSRRRPLTILGEGHDRLVSEKRSLRRSELLKRKLQVMSRARKQEQRRQGGTLLRLASRDRHELHDQRILRSSQAEVMSVALAHASLNGSLQGKGAARSIWVAVVSPCCTVRHSILSYPFPYNAKIECRKGAQ